MIKVMNLVGLLIVFGGLGFNSIVGSQLALIGIAIILVGISIKLPKVS